MSAATPVNLRLLRAIVDGECAATVPALAASFDGIVRDVVFRVHAMIEGGLLSRKVGSEELLVTSEGRDALAAEMRAHGWERPSRFNLDKFFNP